jgi:peptidoglycan/xylan/chitin deacetylase (PgdA/CDA1 family)
MTNRLQQTAFATARASGLFRALRWWHRKDLLVLTYHSVARVDAATRRRYAPLYRNAVSAQHFEKQMRFLKRRYRVIGEDELLAFLDGGSLPERAALLTFDDGLKNNATVAWPILHRHDLPAFFFLPTAFLDDAAANRLRPHWSEELAARFLTDPAAQRGQFDDVLSDLPFEVPNPTRASSASPQNASARRAARAPSSHTGAPGRRPGSEPLPGGPQRAFHPGNDDMGRGPTDGARGSRDGRAHRAP